MATEVLLMDDVKDLGTAGDVVRVADGYARNYLIPGKLAEPVTAAARARLSKLQQQREEARQAERTAAAEMANRLAAVQCTIAVKTGEDGQLYGSVTETDIAEVLRNEGVEIDRHSIELDSPVKELGVFNVKVRLHPDVQAELKVWVVEE